MNMEQLTELFKWMTIINVGLLLCSSLAVMAFLTTIQKMHSKLFGLSREQISVALYAYLGLLKVLVIVFNIVPYISLLILNK